MSHQLRQQTIEWITKQTQLQAACRHWRSKKMLAVDTEFMRSQTYYPITGLLQVNDGEKNYLIDPLTFDNFDDFTHILLDTKITKVLHSCSEDLEVFHRFLGVVPQNLFDTQVAAALTGYGFSVGYGNLVKMVLDLDLPKEETRSDWLHRPLSQSQVEYAAIDVEYLYQLASVLLLKLKNLGRIEWLAEECQGLLKNFQENQSLENCLNRIKQAWRLDARQLAIAKNLAEWREQKARKRDVPRNRVIKEHSIMDIAQMAPTHVGQLRKLEGITDRMIRTDGEEIMVVVSSALELPERDLPQTVPRPLSGAENKWTKSIRAHALATAQALNIAPEVLLKKRDYESLCRTFYGAAEADVEGVKAKLQAPLGGWRYKLLGEELAGIIIEKNAAPPANKHQNTQENEPYKGEE